MDRLGGEDFCGRRSRNRIARDLEAATHHEVILTSTLAGIGAAIGSTSAAGGAAAGAAAAGAAAAAGGLGAAGTTIATGIASGIGAVTGSIGGAVSAVGGAISSGLSAIGSALGIGGGGGAGGAGIGAGATVGGSVGSGGLSVAGAGGSGVGGALTVGGAGSAAPAGLTVAGGAGGSWLPSLGTLAKAATVLSTVGSGGQQIYSAEQQQKALKTAADAEARQTRAQQAQVVSETRQALSINRAGAAARGIAGPAGSTGALLRQNIEGGLADFGALSSDQRARAALFSAARRNARASGYASAGTSLLNLYGAF